ncbi:MAG: 6,7-dimethyl-8-ribityllumazine synthase [Candidatus Latescibacteria bacterium]|nr:6,7-dimethyl-8-ribityllumazine synthase [Candidatus Latescibacterota bacterium]
MAVVVSRFNEPVGERLLEGALRALEDHGVRPRDIAVIRVPGAFEIPVVAKRVAQSGRYAAVVCLGAVIRGETSHFDWIAAEAARGIARAAFETGVPVLFGVLTVDTLQQALDRSGGRLGNKGAEAAAGAVEMATLVHALSERRSD